MPRRHPIHAVNGRLASHAGTVQMDLLWHADALADSVETTVTKSWNQLWRVLKDAPTLNVYALAHQHFRQLYSSLAGELAHGLHNLANWSHDRTATYLADTTPIPYLNMALTPRFGGRFTEAAPGLASFANAGIDIQLADLVSAQDAGDDSRAREIFQAILFQAPSLQRLQQIIYSGAGGIPWTERLRSETKLAAPDAIANILAAGFAAGFGPQQMARELQPIVGGVTATARRIARTEGMRVAHAIQWDNNKAIAGLTLGHQVHAQLDQNTRPHHAARNGTIYYVNPQPGQKGVNEMPHPPVDEDGSVQPNCRCWTSVVLAPPSHIVNNPESMKLFDAHAAKAIPDPHVYGQWFAQAPEYIRRKAVGSARYSAAKAKLGGEPDWAHFWNPRKNRLLTPAEIKSERRDVRFRRLNDVTSQHDAQQRDLAAVATYGFLPVNLPAIKRPEPTPFNVTIHPPESHDEYLRLTGRHFEAHHGIAFTGADVGSVVKTVLKRFGARFQVEHEKFAAERRVYVADNGDLEIRNENFRVRKAHQGQGIGTSIFARQVEQAANLGVKRILTYAAKSSADNGYYTWPRLGYNAILPRDIKEKLPPKLQSADTLIGLFKLPGGDKWWKKHGEDMEMTFDLTPGSESRMALERYMDQKSTAKKKPRITESVQESSKPRHEECDLSEDDEQILDDAWRQYRLSLGHKSSR